MLFANWAWEGQSRKVGFPLQFSLLDPLENCPCTFFFAFRHWRGSDIVELGKMSAIRRSPAHILRAPTPEGPNVAVGEALEGVPIRMANDLAIEFDIFVFAQLWVVLAAQVLQS